MRRNHEQKIERIARPRCKKIRRSTPYFFAAGARPNLVYCGLLGWHGVPFFDPIELEGFGEVEGSVVGEFHILEELGGG